MNLTLRIWAISLVIQPICFGPLAPIIIPIELVGSIPGIIIFGIIVQILLKSDIPFSTKYLTLFISAGALGFLSSYLFLKCENMDIGASDNEALLFSIPATIAALGAVAFSHKKAKTAFLVNDDSKDSDSYYEY
ncbi:hypothetical protein F0919_05495 [Taibaiella lutea]|uniref:Uncharacterized protein n=1 Tax=Taibaiella lutea TaxID=2608001 RepID=A0A5M6CQ59_9BACT|nr:hypothetical protein [Taibaiella lutea]KAA5537126.1 hypothetical protein F0919_05495 [Taibaiella lutea]